MNGMGFRHEHEQRGRHDRMPAIPFDEFTPAGLLRLIFSVRREEWIDVFVCLSVNLFPFFVHVVIETPFHTAGWYVCWSTLAQGAVTPVDVLDPYLLAPSGV